jgi:putative transposase
MVTIVPLLVCLDPVLTATLSRQFSRIALALLTMTGRVTMRGMARWTDHGGSYRTIQRFFATTLPWASLFWLFFRTHCLAPDDVYLLAGDEVVVTKAGKHTHGLDRFFSSLYGKPIPGLAFFALSLISTRERHSFPIRVEQVVRPPAEHTERPAPRRRPKPPPQAPARRPGRPKGRKNTDKTAVTLTPELQQIKGMVQGLLQMIGDVVPLTYLVLDGHFGNNTALQMVRQCTLQLISKLRADSALYLRYDGPYAGHGPQRKYGDKLDYHALPDRYRQQTTIDDGIETAIYQMEALHKECASALNVVILVKTNLTTKAHAHVVLFSSDLTLPWGTLIDYYCLRFQLEFNFRDAKQFWGLEDFMNIRPTAVTNAANLSLFMVNLAYRCLQDMRHFHPEFSVLDLKAHCRGTKYVEETLKLLPEKPEPILLAQIFAKMASLGRIHAAPAAPISP